MAMVFFLLTVEIAFCSTATSVQPQIIIPCQDLVYQHNASKGENGHDMGEVQTASVDDSA
jgi:hypothetical protein